MRVIDIPENPNCSAEELRVFHDLESPEPVVEVCLEDPPGVPRWFAVTGWTLAGIPCLAYAQKVDDSGDGVAYLLFGGDAGLRLRPVESHAPWNLEDPQQRGEAFMVLGALEDIRRKIKGNENGRKSA